MAKAVVHQFKINFCLGKDLLGYNSFDSGAVSFGAGRILSVGGEILYVGRVISCFSHECKVDCSGSRRVLGRRLVV